jgi:hypothetical protein
MKRFTGFEWIVILAIAAIVGFLLIASLILPFLNNQTFTIKVEKVEAVVSSETTKYLIYTETEVFENSDCLIRGKFDSSDFYNDLKDLGTFKVSTYGYRIPLLSMYKNIIKIHEKVKNEELDAETKSKKELYEKLKKEFGEG